MALYPHPEIWILHLNKPQESPIDGSVNYAVLYSQNYDHIKGVNMKTVPLAEAKAKLSRLIDEIDSRDEEVTITRNGKVAAVMISSDQFDSWKETLAIQSDPAMMEEIRRGIRSLSRTKKTCTLDELFNSED
jgi:antitoxin YefM